MKEIKVSRGKIAFVDDEDYDFINSYKWSYQPRGGNEYAVTSVSVGPKKWKSVKMHRMILGLTDPKIFVDHKDHNGLNNQKVNLRPCTPSQNQWNVRPKDGSTSKYLGVSWKAAKKRWYVGIRHNGRHVYLGMSKNEKAAAHLYNEGAKKYFGEFANLNEV